MNYDKTYNYKITAHLINPFDEKNPNPEVVSDYIFIADESKPYKERVKRIKKYPIDGAIETHNGRLDSFIDEDGDGVYLLEKI